MVHPYEDDVDEQIKQAFSEAIWQSELTSLFVDLDSANMHCISHVVLIHLGKFSNLHKMQQAKISQTMNQQMLKEKRTRDYFPSLSNDDFQYSPPTVLVSHVSNRMVSL